LYFKVLLNMKQIIIEYKHENTLRERILLWLLGIVIPVHARFYSKRKAWGLLREDLILYPSGTLGRELGLFLIAEKLQPIDRIERHDAFHILLGFTTKISDEAAMQFFLIGNGKISPFTLSTAIFTAFMLPEQLGNFKYEYHRGKQARSIAKWHFKELLDENMDDIKNAIFRRPVENTNLLVKIEKFENG
jgi:hypothetical protein